MADDLTKSEIAFLIDNLDKMPAYERSETTKMLEALAQRNEMGNARDNFLDYMRTVEPSMLIGPQHRIIGDCFERIAAGTLKRVIINIAPRHGKSTMASYLLPSWYLGKFPDKKIIMASHTGDLAVDFGRKVRNLVNTPIYKRVFPAVTLASDSKAAGRWSTNTGGEYYALGVGSAMAGRGGDIVIIDDPHSEQDAKTGNPAVFDSAYEWYQSGPRQRLMPGGSIVVLMTRWDRRDLSGRLIEQMIKSPDGDEWEVVELPAILPSGKPLWPEFWSLEELLKVKATIDERYWQAQYMQDPVSEQGAIVKSTWWRAWTKEEPPKCTYIIGSLDAAAETNNRADYTALTIWGIFNRDDPESGKRIANIILLDYIRERIEFPELKELAYKQWKKWDMDAFIIEKKSSGTPLYQELFRRGVPVVPYTPHRGTGDKTARLNAVADIWRSGLVWYPEGRVWAQNLIDEIEGFPSYGTDDGLDTSVMAMLRFRQGGFIKLASDDNGEEEEFEPKTFAYY